MSLRVLLIWGRLLSHMIPGLNVELGHRSSARPSPFYLTLGDLISGHNYLPCLNIRAIHTFKPKIQRAKLLLNLLRFYAIPLRLSDLNFDVCG